MTTDEKWRLEYKRTNWAATFGVALAVIAVTLVLLFALIAVVYGQDMHCGPSHPGGPYVDLGDHAARIYSLDPAHPYIGGFQFILSNHYQNVQVSPELLAMPGIWIVRSDLPPTPIYTYELIMVLFPDIHAWPSGLRVLTYDESCASSIPQCINGVTQHYIPWWIRTSASPTAWYPGWLDHVGTLQTTPWGGTLSVTKSPWGAVKELYR